MILVMEMDYRRRSAWEWRREIRNERILELIGLKDTMVDDLSTTQIKWYGHVQRMGEGWLPKQMLLWLPHGRYKRGRTKRNWMEGIRTRMWERKGREDLRYYSER